MEVSTADLSPWLGSNIARIDGQRMRQLQNPIIYKMVDDIGEMSAKAMNLRAPLTNAEKIMNNNNVLYLMWQKDDEKNVSRIMGMLKVGKKNLFFYDKEMKTYNGPVLCVLDFYVHHKCQREGVGKLLFDTMLSSEHAKPCEVAFDTPSVTLLAFLAKHYSLFDPIWQNTNFVVFPDFFESAKHDTKGGYDDSAVDGWQKPEKLSDVPRQLGQGTTPTRWLNQLGKDSQSRERHDHSSAWGADQTTEGTVGNRQSQAKARKAHILGSQPLWCLSQTMESAL